MALQRHEFPIFPLNVVLFPGMSLPIHIFEERYKLMTRQCLSENRTFGVTLIKSGNEVGNTAVPFSVGTLAYIEDAEPLPSGRMNLRTTGRERFRIHQIVQHSPYLKGIIDILPEDAGGDPVHLSLVHTVRKLAKEYLKTLIAIRGEWLREIPIPQEAHGLSYFVAGSLLVANTLRQELLEIILVQERLELELAILRREHPRIKQILLDRHNQDSPRRN